MGPISDPFVVGLSRPGVRAGRLARVLVALKVVESEVVVIVVVVVVGGGGREAPIGPEPVEPVRPGLSGWRDRAEHSGEPAREATRLGCQSKLEGFLTAETVLDRRIGDRSGLSNRVLCSSSMACSLRVWGRSLAPESLLSWFSPRGSV